jgi:hypothetical protein
MARQARGSLLEVAFFNRELAQRRLDLTDLARDRHSLVSVDRLSRYEHLLWRQARQIVFTLESLRRRNRQPSRSNFT